MATVLLFLKEIKVVVGCVVQLRTLHIVKISSTWRKKNCTLRPRLCMEDLRLIWSLPRNELKPGLLCRSCERWENSFRVFRALITESQSYFERSKRVERFIGVTAPSAPKRCRARKTLRSAFRRAFSYQRTGLIFDRKKATKRKK